MCVIITHGPKTAIDREEWEAAWRLNDDGGGIAYLVERKITVAHSMNRDSLAKDYRKALKLHPTVMLIHFRIATHGNATLENCHPFTVRRGEVVAHNGIITQLAAELKPNESDTRALVRLVLRHLPPDWPENPGMAELVANYLNGDKLAVLSTHTAEPLHHFGNWKKGKNGATYSNTFHQWPDSPYGTWEKWADLYDRQAASRALSAPLATGCINGACPHLEHHYRRDLPPVASRPLAAFPGGIDLERLDADADYHADVVEAACTAEGQGYCGDCYWHPCRCGEVCPACTQETDKCLCGIPDWQPEHRETGDEDE